MEYQNSVSGSSNLKELKNNNWNYAITVPPLSVDEIFKVTKSGAIFPQKSTYFYMISKV